ncbi:spore maturation protein CgeB [Paenibacillus sp. DS2015]|uniref:glycosyltransferase family protein n=1 Tax=Paenibacillus sp. DS2015 TaxID=3373917 RepID=UPI003D19A8E1
MKKLPPGQASAYLNHPEQADQIAAAARLRCLNEHTGSKRLGDIFEQLDWELLEHRNG